MTSKSIFRIENDSEPIITNKMKIIFTGNLFFVAPTKDVKGIQLFKNLKQTLTKSFKLEKPQFVKSNECKKLLKESEVTQMEILKKVEGKNRSFREILESTITKLKGKIVSSFINPSPILHHTPVKLLTFSFKELINVAIKEKNSVSKSDFSSQTKFSGQTGTAIVEQIPPILCSFETIESSLEKTIVSSVSSSVVSVNWEKPSGNEDEKPLELHRFKMELLSIIFGDDEEIQMSVDRDIKNDKLYVPNNYGRDNIFSGNLVHGLSIASNARKKNHVREIGKQE